MFPCCSRSRGVVHLEAPEEIELRDIVLTERDLVESEGGGGGRNRDSFNR